MIRFQPLRCALGALLAVSAAASALAQQADDGDVDSVSVPVVQAVPNGDSARLNDALGRLGRNPRDFVALLDAGSAALGMGDSDAAIGFFQRADSITPGNPRAKAGLASAYVRREDPFTAIPLFAEAEKLGPLDAVAQMDRGLAYDLVGDNASAQRYYTAVLALGRNDEASRRMALSQAISGNRAGMDTALSALLQRQDKAAWRTRAFGLAILGKADEAEAIAKQTLTPDLAIAMGAYLRYMPRLTPAQQAAAGSLGKFPLPAEIGHDDPRVALYAKPRTALASADKPLVPTGAPLGRSGSSSRSGSRDDSGSRRRDRPAEKPPKPAPTPVSTPVRTAPPEPQPSRDLASGPARVFATPAAVPTPTPPPPAATRPVAAAPVVATPPRTIPPATTTAPALAATNIPAVSRPVATTTPPASAPATSPGFTALETPAPRAVSGFDLAQTTGSTAAAPPVAPAARPTPAPVPAKPGSLAEVFADLDAPSREAVPQAGAVDIRAITPTRPGARMSGDREPVVTRGSGKPATPVKPVPSHPSRIWVQLSTVREKAALGADWRRLARADPDVFKGRKPFTSAFGQSNRLLTGPFESQAQANAFIAQLKKAGVAGAYVWTSPAGQVVDTLAVK